jgi:hypothetical protein
MCSHFLFLLKKLGAGGSKDATHQDDGKKKATTADDEGEEDQNR